MDSDSQSEDEKITKQIFDYYQQFSQNKDLPKYFSGSSVSYMPEIIQQDDIVIEESEKNEQSPVKQISPCSSITSNKKLEWDNGADIGYNVCTKVQKSASLPVLVGLEEVPKMPNFNTQIITVISSSTSTKTVQSSSSTPSLLVIQEPSSTSSSIPLENKAPQTSSGSSEISYLKSKIGTPDAESTPKSISNEPKTLKNNARKRNIPLCVTKPVIVECLDLKQLTNQQIQTAITQNEFKSVQTGASLNSANKSPQNSNQSLVCIYTGDKKSASSTSPMVASSCDSFQYYPDNLKKSSSSSDSSSKIPLLAQLIEKKQSQSLTGDIDKSIDILQKLLKSKKYDSVTKKRYIKKIVKKIIDSKYSGDSTTSSELFQPAPPKLQDNLPWFPPEMSKFSVNTFTDEFVPLETKINNKPRTIFTLGDKERVDQKQKSSSGGSYPSWQLGKTFSECLLEGKQQVSA